MFHALVKSEWERKFWAGGVYTDTSSAEIYMVITEYWNHNIDWSDNFVFLTVAIPQGKNALSGDTGYHYISDMAFTEFLGSLRLYAAAEQEGGSPKTVLIMKFEPY